jgi:nucleoside-diphosphate-sugar epimerase
MRREAKIYVAGHRGMVGSALVRRLNSKEPVIFAGRNKYDSRLLRERGIECHAIQGQMAARS